MYSNEVWNTVSADGPQSEIDRMKALCSLPNIQVPTSDAVVDFSALMPDSGWGGEYYTWNRVTYGPHKPGEFRFGFDSQGCAPVEIFEALAKEFPSLSFRCSCIGSMDEFMAFGCFNGPPGSEEFTYEDVPADHWGPVMPEDEEEDEVSS